MIWIKRGEHDEYCCRCLKKWKTSEYNVTGDGSNLASTKYIKSSWLGESRWRVAKSRCKAVLDICREAAASRKPIAPGSLRIFSGFAGRYAVEGGYIQLPEVPRIGFEKSQLI